MKMSELIPNRDRVWITYTHSFEVELRHMDATLLKEITDYAAVRGTRKRGSGINVDELDEKKLYSAYAKFLILNWKGIEDEDGKPLECSIENKELLIRENTDFRKWVTDCSGNVDNFIDIPTPEDEKKSSISLVS